MYTLGEQVYRQVSVLTAFTISAVIGAVVLGATLLFNPNLTKDLHTIASSRETLLLIAAQSLLNILATLAIGLSIQGRNATVAGLIEMTYPLFIVLTGYLLFRTMHLNLATAVGAAFITVGVTVVYIFNH